MKQNSQQAIQVSKALKDLAKSVENQLYEITGDRVAFSLFVWSDNRANYIANCPRPEVVTAVTAVLDSWSKGLPDVPAHEVQ